MKTDLSADEARRIAIAAQGFLDPGPVGNVDVRHLRRVLRRIGLVQIDSVNAVVRSHYLPFFSRLGPYPMTLLDDLAYRRRELFEYWAHEASLVPVEREPLLRHRMSAWPTLYPRRITWIEEHREYFDAVLEEVRARGPLAASELDDPGERRGPWWGHGKGKIALELHFGMGTVAVARRRNFARMYDLRERVLPARVRDQEAKDPDTAVQQLALLAARHHGVGTARDLADYYRLPIAAARHQLDALADLGALQRVRVEGWREPAYLDPAARLPRRIEAQALIAPFDPLVWERDRTARLFNFDYRIEIYTPAQQRRYGYYVMPLLLDERLVARVDLKADRKRDVLLAPAVYGEPGVDPERVVTALRDELSAMAHWLELDRVEVGRTGDLALPLRRALG